MDGFLSSLDPEGLGPIIKSLVELQPEYDQWLMGYFVDGSGRYCAQERSLAARLLGKAQHELEVTLQTWAENPTEYYTSARKVAPRIDAVCKALEIVMARPGWWYDHGGDRDDMEWWVNGCCFPNGSLSKFERVMLPRLTLWREQLYANAVFEALTGGAIEGRPGSVPDAGDACEDTPTIQDIYYADEDPAARRSEELLTLQAEHDWADNVEHAIRQGAGSDQDGEAIYMYPYKRAPKEFKEALLEGPELLHVRQKLDAVGYPYVLAGSCAKVFVQPEHYQAVVNEIDKRNIKLKASYVIIAESLIPELEAALSQIASSKNVTLKQSCVSQVMRVATGQATLRDDGVQQGAKYELSNMDKHISVVGKWEDIFDVRRTFLGIAQPDLKASSAVTQSTSEVHGGVNWFNPRRHLQDRASASSSS